ncbi:pyruvate, phosphate dikinase [Micavibrio aeruginosavorus]|uniref:Pyruvate, phosphate dikinase n=1 Tax=Micavibrio aeruginosavorus (strain ARL-13) TaxID=856793 RepID=G2KQH5_MICAA|nr:pyruvate, phosphate dikinase [Micavibrio aeruginosavorus]AEP09111.1 pyruvate, phosphate dikinase [Micavibrio aeruginosavorus ARL-13]
MTTQWVYSFGAKESNARPDTQGPVKNLLGGKGANLAEMASLGLPVPPGFTITTEVCTAFYKNAEQYPAELRAQVDAALKKIENAVGVKFGDAKNPLLLSVRSGARVSMPGMMDTVLNLGLNDETVVGLATSSGDERFAWDSYRRFVQMYGDVVLGVSHHDFEDILDQQKRDDNVFNDTDLSADAWKNVVAEYKALVKRDTGADFPMNPVDQLWGAVGAVFKSWMTARAVSYRAIHDIPEDWGTAVNVQAMVFGNMGDDCATGVAFTRDPSTGENYFYGEYLINAQGEDVVAGIRTPQSLTILGREKEGSNLPSMEETMPGVFKQLDDVRQTLEKHYRDMQDIEFTVQSGTLYMLQTRTGKRTSAAALKIAVDMVGEGLITKEEALLRLEPQALDQLLHPTLDPAAHKTILTRGLPASPGAASGIVVFSADDAEAMAKDGKKVILCRRETSPEDIHGMHAAAGILTTRGGMTSHAAVVARGMGRACVAGAGALQIDYETATMRVGDRVVKAGDVITIDGGAGEVMLGAVPTVQPELSGDFATVMQWADDVRRMGVRANAETPLDAKTARGFGAEGIGLCRTEHMFFDPTRIQHVREMIFANNAPARRDALAKLLPAQRGDFAELFEIMRGLPVTIRLLDPPLHEFLPQSDADIAEFARIANIGADQVRMRLRELHETNPMLGHRGCRLGMTYPEIYEMQARAIFEAAIKVDVTPEIMIPLIATHRELAVLKKLVDETAVAVFAETGKTVSYTVGTMIELPRAALTADEIAPDAAFFSFGTNDLTQTTLGLSRDDSALFMNDYLRQGVFARDPFATLDIDGVGQLVRIAVEKGRKVRPDIKLGICGEHGGDPASIAFCESVGLHYVSCSPYRVPIARLAAAQATIRENAGKKPDAVKRAA